MAQLSATDAAGRSGKKKDKGQIEGTFEREVPPEGGQQDFDVKSAAASK
ncbi:hypothetical protein SAMN05444166_1311 [Singulisphaera sp. GP187]|nr:hypothetical protein [Singulisphaera sp. GP187]SIN86024.1 hypothetical protein SAMN05444166_1311 [Singulisphaera sp. GP187]